MDNFSLLQEAIKNKNVLEFDYTKKDGSVSHRIVHPYVLYIYTAKADWKESMKLWVVQVWWESDSSDEFPCFKDFLDIKDINNILIREDLFHAPFHKDYVPESSRYENLIIKV